MLDDRGPQITMEVVNGTDLNEKQINELGYEVPLTHGKRDLRAAIQARAITLLNERQIPISPRFGGNFALDFAVEGGLKNNIYQICTYDARCSWNNRLNRSRRPRPARAGNLG
jgi:hypothetical protein